MTQQELCMRSLRSVGVLQPLGEQRLELAHVLEGEVQGLEPGDGYWFTLKANLLGELCIIVIQTYMCNMFSTLLSHVKCIRISFIKYCCVIFGSKKALL